MSQSIKPTQRARVSTHRGFVVDAFSPFHCEFNIGSPDEFSEEICMSKIKTYSE
jgi:hypothetical protein